ncbi:hypothetical protein BU15DRAFT_64444 [Melanogaster broomeanus]|nr:hypothetical protein BU15DRAFT_64444 [Melanogaster broomeanus]
MSSIEITDQRKLDTFFPVPALPPSPLSPQRLPGSSLESLAALQHVLKDNHSRYHIFFNYTWHHNHVTHRALAIYASGGSASLIKDYYEQDAKNQRPAVESPEPITEENFLEHLEDEKNVVGSFYQSYVTFFSEQIDEKGAAGTLEEFIFSEKYNFQDGRDATNQPEMLLRLMDGLLHPYDPRWLRGRVCPTAEVDGTADLLSSLVLNAKPAAAAIISKTSGVHAFDIIARMLKDDQLKPKAVSRVTHQFPDTLRIVILRYAQMWTVDLTKPGEIERKMEELIWVNSIMYGVGGFDARKRSNRISTCASFTHCPHSLPWTNFTDPRVGKDAHGDVESVPSLLDRIPFPTIPSSLLRAYFTMVLIWWVACGRPALNFKPSWLPLHRTHHPKYLPTKDSLNH